MVYDEGFIHVIWGFHSWYKMMVSFIIYGDISFMVYNEDFLFTVYDEGFIASISPVCIANKSTFGFVFSSLELWCLFMAIVRIDS